LQRYIDTYQGRERSITGTKAFDAFLLSQLPNANVMLYSHLERVREQRDALLNSRLADLFRVMMDDFRPHAFLGLSIAPDDDHSYTLQLVAQKSIALL
jgi:hypothetical protein